MDYKAYQDNHFGEPIDIYNASGNLVYQGIEPVASVEPEIKNIFGMDLFSFSVGGDSTVLVPASCDFVLSSENSIEAEDTI